MQRCKDEEDPKACAAALTDSDQADGGGEGLAGSSDGGQAAPSSKSSSSGGSGGKSSKSGGSHGSKSPLALISRAAAKNASPEDVKLAAQKAHHAKR